MPSPLRMKNGCSITRVLTSRLPRGPPHGRVPEIDVGRVLPREPAVRLPDLARRSGGGHAEHRVVVAPHALLLLSEVLELRVDDLALLRTGGTAGSAAGLRTRAWTGRLLPCLGLRLAVHGLAELVGRLRQRLLRPLHALEVARLERLLGLGERIVDRLAVGLGELASVLRERPLRRIDQ